MDRDRLERAFRAAHEAGDTEAATRFANKLRSMQKEQAPAEKEPESTQTGLEKAAGLAQSYLQGVSLGWADEALAYPRAVGDIVTEKLLGEESGGQTFQERVETMRLGDEANRKQFGKENPITAFSAELAGGIASPVNKIPLGVAAKGNIPQRIASSVLRGGAEGAVAGAGSAGPGERGEGAQSGAAWGAGMSGLMSGLGGTVGRVVSHRAVDQDLVNPATGEFTPIHMTDREGLLGDIYRNTLGRGWGSGHKLRAQSRPFIEAAENAVDEAEAVAQRKIERTDNVVKGLKRAATKAKQKADDQARLSKAGVDDARARLEGETAEALSDDAVNFRAVAAQEAVPDDFRVGTLKDVDLDDTKAVSRQLKDFWDNDAFREVKDRDFNWNESIVEDLRVQFQQDPGLFLSMSEAPAMVQAMRRTFGLSDELVEALGRGNATEQQLIKLSEEMVPPPTLKIDGDALMEMRNFFARNANKGGDNARAYNRVRQAFDADIQSQLKAIDPELERRFVDQKTRYPTYLNYRKAVQNSKAEGGKFTPGKWLTAGGRFGDYDIGTQPLQSQADEVILRSQGAKTAGGLDKASRKHAKKRVDQRARAQKRRIDQRLEDRLDRLNPKRQNKLARNEVKVAKEALADVKAASPPEKPTGLSEMLTTRSLGQLVAGTGVGTANILTGGIVGSGLASQRGQQIMAGQTGLQKALRKAIEEGDTNTVTRILARERAREENE